MNDNKDQTAQAATRVGAKLAASRNVVIQRLVVSAVLGCIASLWTGPVFAAIWYAAIVMYELWGAGAARKLFVEPHADTPRARYAMAAIMCVGNVLYFVAIAAAWYVGGVEFAPIALVYICIGVMHAMTFHSGDRLMFLVSAAPPALTAIVMPFVTAHSPMALIPLLLAIAQFLFIVSLAIRDRKILIDRTVRYRTEAAEAERASLAKSQFLATMSHELRTPLNAVIGYAEIMKDDLADGRPAREEDADRIVAAARNLLGLINDVLDLSKMEAGNVHLALEPASLTDIVRAVTEQTAPIAQANGNTLAVAIDPSADEIVTDAARLRQCALNLVSNACKFTHHGTVTISAKRDGARVRVDIADTGIGMTAEDAARLFQPFQQADSSTTRKYGGAGLGLAITKKLCDLLGGELTLRSAPGKGTTVTMWLPMAAETAAAHAA